MCLPVRVLCAEDFHSGERLDSWMLGFNRQFSVRYTHSVERSDVTELYQIERGHIYLEETLFSSFGAGLPSDKHYAFEITPEGFRLYAMHELIDPLVYRTATTRGNHQLLIKQRAYPFLDFSGVAQAVRFQTKLIPLWSYLFQEVR